MEIEENGFGNEIGSAADVLKQIVKSKDFNQLKKYMVSLKE